MLTYYGWAFYGIIDCNGVDVVITITNVAINEFGTITVFFYGGEKEDGEASLSWTEFNSLFGNYLYNKNIASIVGRSFKIVVDTFFEDEDGNYSCEPYSEVVLIDEVTDEE